MKYSVSTLITIADYFDRKGMTKAANLIDKALERIVQSVCPECGEEIGGSGYCEKPECPFNQKIDKDIPGGSVDNEETGGPGCSKM